MEHVRAGGGIAPIVEGVGVNAAVGETGVSNPTILKLRHGIGSACIAYHDQDVRGLKLKRIAANIRRSKPAQPRST